MSRKTYRKIITSPELIERINPINKKLIERFLKSKNAKCSDRTIENYRSDLNIFFCYNAEYNDNKSFLDLTKLEISDFFDYALLELKWSGNRYARERSLIKGFGDFIENTCDEEFPNFRNKVDKAVDKVPKEPVRKKTVVKEEEVYKLRDSLKEEGKLQQACYLMLLAACGARISETLRITTDLIDENHTAFDGIFLETTDEIKTKGRGKRGTMMSKYIIKDVFLPIYNEWMEERAKVLEGKGLNHNSIFIRKDGKPITTSGVRAWIDNWTDILGVDLYAHAFRHFIVSDLTRKGCSSDFIVAVMKWKSSDMYKIYNDIEDKDRKWKDIDKLKGVFSQES